MPKPRTEKIDIYQYEEQLQSVYRRIENSEITEKNKKLIKEFLDYCFAEGLSVPRVIKYATTLLSLARLLGKDFDKTTKQDIVRVVGKIERNSYSAWTKKDFKVTLKKFYKWLRQTDDYPEEVKWLKTTLKKSEEKLPEELLTEEDIQKMVNAVNDVRDKALIITLYESGARIGEIASLRIKQVHFDEHGTVLIIKGKTGMRRVRLIASDPYLRQWVNAHPAKDDPEAPLWIKRNKKGVEPLDYASISKIIKRAAKKAEIKKRVHAHLFRHSRATFLAKYLTEAQLCQYFGWAIGSEMASVYVHLSGRDMDEAILGLYGFKIKKEPVAKNIPKECPRCGYKNPSDAKFCSNCGLALSVEAMREIEEKEKLAEKLLKILEDEEVKQVIAKKLKILNSYDL